MINNAYKLRCRDKGILVTTHPEKYNVVWKRPFNHEIYSMDNEMKKEIGRQIKGLRKELGVSTYSLEQKGIHPGLPGTIEKGVKGYSIDSLIKYLNAINETYLERDGKINKKELVVQVLRYSQSQK